MDFAASSTKNTGEKPEDLQDEILFLKGKLSNEKRRRKETVTQLQKQIYSLKSELAETKQKLSTKLRRDGIEEGKIEQKKRLTSSELIFFEDALQDAEWKRQNITQAFKRLKQRVRFCAQCSVDVDVEKQSLENDTETTKKKEKQKKKSALKLSKVRSGKVKKSRKRHSKKVKSLTKALESFQI
ncbi:unnamed protein product, partial [Mesorhabditis belari]|uniref:Uncharacterized protein n=1 Tax=Mesorhabditis belari TaxID=2138241 RepID=A0AAF3JA06_9BILA